MKFESNALDIISIKSENFKARFVADFYELKNPAEEVRKLKEMFDNTVENTNNLSEIEQFDMVLQNFFEKIPSKISDMNMTLSTKVCTEKPIYEWFNKYSDMFSEKISDNFCVENDVLPLISITKNECMYILKYDTAYGKIKMTAFEDNNANYNITSGLKISDIKNALDIVKNINMPDNFDNSGKLENYKITSKSNYDKIIKVSKADSNFHNTRIDIIDNNNLNEPVCSIDTQVSTNNEKLLENIFQTLNEMTYCDYVDFASEFSNKIIKNLYEIKTDMQSNKLTMKIPFYREPCKIFIDIMSNNIDSNCDINIIVPYANKLTEYRYDNEGIVSLTMTEDSYKNTEKIYCYIDNMNKYTNISYDGNISDDFKTECMETIKEISDYIPEFNKLTEKMIYTMKNNIDKENLDL